MSIDPASVAVAAPDTRLAFLIYRAGVAVSRVLESRLRPLGLTPGQLGLMTYLTATGESHVRAVARALGLSPQTVVNLTRALEAKGLLERQASSTDGRVLLVSLNAAGLKLLSQADAVARGVDAEVLATAEKADELIARTLRRVISLQADTDDRQG